MWPSASSRRVTFTNAIVRPKNITGRSTNTPSS
jgi:hypothetical protein